MVVAAAKTKSRARLCREAVVFMVSIVGIEGAFARRNCEGTVSVAAC
jgi:hypothetical protein